MQPLRRISNSAASRRSEEFVFWVNSGITCIYKAQRGRETEREREREREGEEELPSSPSPLLPLVLPLNHRAKKHSLTTSADPPLGRPLPALCILERFHRRLSSLPFHCIIRNDPHSLNRKLFHLKSSGDGLFSLNSSAAQRNHFDKVSYRIMDAGMDLHRTVHSA